MIDCSAIKGVLFDIDGTLTQNYSLLPGAASLVEKLRKNGCSLRFLTNMTGISPSELCEKLQTQGLGIDQSEVITAVTACAGFLRHKYPGKTGFHAVPEKTAKMLPLPGDNEVDPAYVLLGDLDEQFTYELLNKMFRHLDAGAELVAFHRNPFYFKQGKKTLDSGGFTQALEYAAGVQAHIIGKPSEIFFKSALRSMGLRPDQALVVGDDLRTDIKGANDTGIRSVLVGTGKFTTEDLRHPAIKADWYIENLTAIEPYI